MKRIAIVAPNYHPRTCGVGDYSMRLGQELQRRGHTVLVLSRQPAEPHPDAPTVSVMEFRAPTALLCAASMLRFIAKERIDEVLVQYTPQMLGASRFGSAALAFMALGLRRRGIRLKVVAHELFFRWSLRPDIALGAAIQRAQALALLALADDFVLTTHSRRHFVEPLARLVRRKKPVRIIPVGSNALPVGRDETASGFRLGVFSTLAHGKRFDVVLEAFRLVSRDVPEAELVLVGDFGEGERRRDLEASVASQPHAQRIRLTGKLPLPEVARIVAGLHVFLFPLDTGATTRSSTLPLALGSGVPVVAIRGHETDELFRSDENVVFAESLTGDAFALATQRIRSDPELARRVAAGGRRTYAEALAWPVIASSLVAQWDA